MTAPTTAEVDRMIRCATTTARRYANTLPAHADRDAVLGEALLAVAEAIDTYDPTRGAAYATWAYYRVLGAIREEMRRQDVVSRDRRAALKAGATALPHEHPPLSIEAIWLEEGDAWEPADECAQVATCALASVEAHHLWSAVAELPEREARAIVLYFVDGLTFRAVGKRLGLSETRIHQVIRDQALPRLRAALEVQG